MNTAPPAASQPCRVEPSSFTSEPPTTLEHTVLYVLHTGPYVVLSTMSPEQRRRDGRDRELRGTARARLGEAALAELRERGHAATSPGAIARRAGLTRGAIYWNFESKEDLFLELLEERVDGPVRELMKITESAPSEAPTAAAVSRGVAELVA